VVSLITLFNLALRSNKKERIIFYHHLCSTRYPRNFLRTVFHEVTWARRSLLLARSRQETCNEFVKTYLACVLTLRNAPKWAALMERLDQSLKELMESTFGDIFPQRAFLAQSSAPRLDRFLNVNESTRGGGVRLPGPRW